MAVEEVVYQTFWINKGSAISVYATESDVNQRLSPIETIDYGALFVLQAMAAGEIVKVKVWSGSRGFILGYCTKDVARPNYFHSNRMPAFNSQYGQSADVGGDIGWGVLFSVRADDVPVYHGTEYANLTLNYGDAVLCKPGTPQENLAGTSYGDRLCVYAVRRRSQVTGENLWFNYYGNGWVPTGLRERSTTQSNSYIYSTKW